MKSNKRIYFTLSNGIRVSFKDAVNLFVQQAIKYKGVK